MLQYYRINLQLTGLTSPGRLLTVYFLLFVAFSCLGKLAATMVATFKSHALWFVVVFLLCLDYLAVTAFYWWLRGRTMQGNRTRVQLKYIASTFSLLSAFLLLVAVIGAALNRWLLALEVSPPELTSDA
jgi:phosphoglycerol transferase MdoB-like AlkP superfamily enzyme